MDGYIFPNEAEFQWSALIVLYPFITGLVAGAFVVSSLYHVFGLKNLKPVARLALLTALAFLLIAPLPLQAHLGRPERAFLIFLTPHFTSAMAGFGFIWLCYLILVVAETWLVFRPDIVAYAQRSTGLVRSLYSALALGVYDVSKEALEADRRLIGIMAAIGIPAAVVLHGYVGFIFGAVKANPWWSTPLMPPIFLLSAIVSGMALLVIIYVVSMSLLGRPIDHGCVRAMGMWLAGFFLIDDALEVLELLAFGYEARDSWPMIRGLVTREIGYSYLGIQLYLGTLVPLVLLGSALLLRVSRITTTALVTLASVHLVTGVLAMRWNVVVGGQLISKSLRGYTEYEWIFGGREGVFMAALLLLLPMVLFVVLVSVLPPWLEPEGERAGEAAPVRPNPSAHSAQELAALRERGAAAHVRVPPKRYVGLKLTLAGLGATMAALFLGVVAAPGHPRLLEFGASSPEQVVVPQFRSVFPAKLLATYYEPQGGAWVEPLDVTVMGERIFVLDHDGRQVVETSHEGRFVRHYNHETTEGLELNHPHAMANDGRYVYIANTFPPRIYVLDPDAGLERTIELPPSAVEGIPTVPTGLAFTQDGNLVVSDGQNHRLLLIAPDGSLLQFVVRPKGSWVLASPGGGENTLIAGGVLQTTSIATAGRPGSVAVASNGTILAADILGPGLTRVGADGASLGHFAGPDDPVGGLLRPTDIAVDSQGRIYVGDDLVRGVQVYSPDGAPLGLIGRPDPNSFIEPSMFERPSSLAVQGDKLYVVDRGRGLLIYQIP
ncbi:MAG: hypothetical protein A2Z17_04645 [Gammaproteobacteria bacterium RBG_16_66_13]|nr:MAG: hypothetical protein A2Z17_04645 [Gammaproteobacteria bacterium RBG_16_66_13]